MSKFTDEAAAIEECEFLAEETGLSHSIVQAYDHMVIIQNKFVTDSMTVLETIHPNKEGN